MLNRTNNSHWKAWITRLCVLLMIASVCSVVGCSDDQPKKKKKMTKITLKDLPPPPPPPPPKEQPKEKPKEQPKKIKVEKPKPKPVEAPPAEQLKMEGAAGDGPSPFAAGEVTNEYTGGDVNTIGGGTDKRQFAWYTNQIKDSIEAAISKDEALANGAYKLVVKIWVSSNGSIKRHVLVRGSGQPDIDEKINQALRTMSSLDAPPSDLPQPVKLRVTARSLG